MPAPIYTYPLDPTGLNPNNLVQGEQHTLAPRTRRLVATNYGGFFTESMHVFDVATGQELAKDTQYRAVEMFEVPTAKYGKEVCGLIEVIDTNVSNKISLNYQTVGGEYSISAVAIRNALTNLAIDNRPANWPDIINKPSEFPPTHHLHDVGDVYGFEYMVHALERIRRAIELGDDLQHEWIYRYIDQSISLIDYITPAAANGLMNNAISVAAADATTKANAAQAAAIAAAASDATTKSGAAQAAAIAAAATDASTKANAAQAAAASDATTKANAAQAAAIAAAATDATSKANAAQASSNTYTDTSLTNHNSALDPHTQYMKEGGDAGAGATVPTPTAGDNTTKIANTAFVKTAVDTHVGLADPHNQYALEGGDMGTGATVATPAQFDDTTKLATTAFVRRSGHQYAPPANISAATVLTAADAGKAFQLVLSSSFTLTLPAGSALQPGVAIGVVVKGSGFVASIAPNAADTITSGQLSGLTSMNMMDGDWCELTYWGSNIWVVTQGNTLNNQAGQLVITLGTTAPTGTIKANGTVLQRSQYPRLWAYAQASANLTTTDAEWTGDIDKCGKFSPGDGTTTFRIPDLRGYHLRMLDDSRGVDVGRGIGTGQTDQSPSHNHTITDPGHNHGVTNGNHTHGTTDPGHTHTTTRVAPTGINEVDGGDTGSLSLQMQAPTTTGSSVTNVTVNAAASAVSLAAASSGITLAAAGTGTETRVKTVAVLACIRY